MSYDLYFYKRKSSDLTEKQVSEYLNTNLSLNNSEVSTQWTYENEDTGVYFSIDWEEPYSDQEDIDIWDNFTDFEYLNFNFTINFIRPNFFAFEAFPVLEKIIDDLDLYILNSQDEINPDNPRKYEKGYFEKQWIAHNNGIIIEHFDEFQVYYLPPETSDYIWNYQFQRNNLQENLDEDIFVAGYFMIKRHEDNKIFRVCVWPKCIPIIIPPVDYIIIEKEYKKFFKKVKESGFVSYEKINEKLGKFFEDFEHEIPNLKVLRQSNADKVLDIFNSLEIECTTKDFGTLISFDSFVNVKPLF